MVLLSFVKRSELKGVLAFNLLLPLIKALMPKLLWRAFRLKDPFSILVPAVKDRFPLYPFALFVFKMILIIPPNPCASYFAPGLVITSMLLIWLAGIDCNTSVILLPKASEGLPSIRKRM